MKYLFITTLWLSFCSLSMAQSPETMGYQAAVRSPSGEVLTNHLVGLQLAIRQHSVTGVIVYQEQNNIETNEFGLIDVEIGLGTPIVGTFGNIEWDNGPYFIETAIDFTGGNTYEVIGAAQILSVPYALNAQTSESVTTKTKAERVLMVNPKAGNLIFCKDCGASGELQIYNGTKWTNMIGEPIIE